MLGEDLRDLGHDEGNEEKQDHRSDDQHDDRIEHGIGDFGPEGLLFFQKLRQPEQDLIEGAARFTGPHHVDIDGRKVLVVGFQDRAQRLSAANLFPDVGEEGFDGLFFGLIDEHAQGVDQRQAGDEQRGKLPGEQREVVAREDG